MSEVRVNIVTPRTTTNVDIQGLAQPTWNGQPLAVEPLLDGMTIANADPGNFYTATNVGTQLQEIPESLRSLLSNVQFGTSTDLLNVSIANLLTRLYRTACPMGKVIFGYWPGSTPPFGTIFLEGQLITKTAQYTPLYDFAVAEGLTVAEAAWLAGQKSKFSVVNGSNQFYVPDFRGYFVRTLDTSGTVDPDGASRTIGSRQADETGPHTHTLSPNILTEGIAGLGPGGTTSGESGVPPDTNANTGVETRPKNIALRAAMYY